jgi:hypothetical protein
MGLPADSRQVCARVQDRERALSRHEDARVHARQLYPGHPQLASERPSPTASTQPQCLSESVTSGVRPPDQPGRATGNATHADTQTEPALSRASPSFQSDSELAPVPVRPEPAGPPLSGHCAGATASASASGC